VSTVSGLRLGEKRYEWLIIPTTAGTQIFTPVTFSFFDPRAAVFRTIEADEVQIEVLPAEDGADVLFSQPSRSALTMMNLQTSSEADRHRSSFILWLLWAAAPLAFVALLLWRYGQETLEHREATHRQNGALVRALNRLERIGANVSPRTFGQMEEVVVHYVTERSSQPLTDPGLVQAVQLCGDYTSPETIAGLETCLREIEAQRYTPPRLLERESIAVLIAKLAEAIQRVDAEWSGAG
jgi:hypothetical protein